MSACLDAQVDGVSTGNRSRRDGGPEPLAAPYFRKVRCANDVTSDVRQRALGLYRRALSRSRGVGIHEAADEAAHVASASNDDNFWQTVNLIALFKRMTYLETEQESK